MAILPPTVTTGTTQVRVKMSSLSMHSGLGPIDESVMEIKSSKTREERQMVDAGRRSSVQDEGAKRYKERRGSKDSSRRKSSAASGDLGDLKKHHGSAGAKRAVLVTKG